MPCNVLGVVKTGARANPGKCLRGVPVVAFGLSPEGPAGVFGPRRGKNEIPEMPGGSQTHGAWGHGGQGAGQTQEPSQKPSGCQAESSTRRLTEAPLCSEDKRVRVISSAYSQK